MLHDVFLPADSGPAIIAELTRRGVDLNVGFEHVKGVTESPKQFDLDKWPFLAFRPELAFVIRTLPNLRERTDTAWRLRATTIKLINPGEIVCINRARAAGRSEQTIEAIRTWFNPQIRPPRLSPDA
jgi:hypothetical protein